MILTGQAAKDYINAGNKDWKAVSGFGENTDYLSEAQRLMGMGYSLQSQIGSNILDQNPLGLANLTSGISRIINRPNQISMALRPQATNFASTPEEIKAIEDLRKGATGEYIKAGLGIGGLTLPFIFPAAGLAGLGVQGLSGLMIAGSQNQNPETLLQELATGGALGLGAGAAFNLGGNILGAIGNRFGVPSKLASAGAKLKELSPITAETISPLRNLAKSTTTGIAGNVAQRGVLADLINQLQSQGVKRNVTSANLQDILSQITGRTGRAQLAGSPLTLNAPAQGLNLGNRLLALPERGSPLIYGQNEPSLVVTPRQYWLPQYNNIRGSGDVLNAPISLTPQQVQQNALRQLLGNVRMKPAKLPEAPQPVIKPTFENTYVSPPELVRMQSGKTAGFYGETPNTMAQAPKTGVSARATDVSLYAIQKPYTKQAIAERVTELRSNAAKEGIVKRSIKQGQNAKANEVLISRLSKDLSAKIEGADFGNLTNGDLLQRIYNKAINQDVASVTSNTFDTLANKFKGSLNDKVSGKTIEDIRQWVMDQFKTTAKKGLDQTQLTSAQTVLDATHETLDEIISPVVPGAKQSLFDIHALSSDANGIYNMATDKGKAFMKGIPIPLKKFEYMVKGAYDVIKNKELTVNLPKMPNAIGGSKNLGIGMTTGGTFLPVGGLAAILGNNTVSQNNLLQAPTTVATAPGTTKPSGDLVSNYLLSDTTGLSGLEDLLNGTQGANQAKINNIMANLMRGGMTDPAKLKIMLELLGVKSPSTGGGAKLPSGALKSLAELRSGLHNVDTLEAKFKKDSSAFNPITGGIRATIPWDLSGQQAKATVALVKQIIGKALEGGVLRKEDEEKYAHILPTVFDTPEQVQYKIDLLRQTLQNKYDAEIEQYQMGGYDPYLGQNESTSDTSTLLQNLLLQ